MHHGKVIGKCKKCGHDLEIPVRAEGTFSIDAVPMNEAFYVNDHEKTVWCRKCKQYHSVRINYPETIGLTLTAYDPSGDLKF